jgi:hypothetical protein
MIPNPDTYLAKAIDRWENEGGALRPPSELHLLASLEGTHSSSGILSQARSSRSASCFSEAQDGACERNGH